VTAYPVTAGLCVLALLATFAWWGQAGVSVLFSDARAFHGEGWRLLTACLPHVNLLHLIFNLYWLWVFCTLVEEAFGQAHTVALLLLLAAGSSAVAGAFGEDGVGLSGVGYGLFALLWVLGRRDEARQLLERAGEGLPKEKDLEPLHARYAKHWPDALSALLQQAAGWLRLGQAERAEAALAEARALLFPAKAVAPEQRPHRVAYARLACAYARAVGQRPSGEALGRLEELFRRLEPRPDTFTTATHYALLDLSVIESAVFALLPDDESAP
jgi:hypothetical protein